MRGRNYAATDLEWAAEAEFLSSLRPGCSAAFQCDPESAGLIVELRLTFKGDVDELAHSVRQHVQAACGIDVCVACLGTMDISVRLGASTGVHLLHLLCALLGLPPFLCFGMH